MTRLENMCLTVIRRHRGKDAAISFRELARVGGYDERHVRRAVEALIHVHRQPICSSYDKLRPGYYWPVSPDEIEDSFHRLMRHGVRIIQRARAIRKVSAEEVFGQLRLLMDEEDPA